MKKNQVTENWMPARYIREDETILDFTNLYEASSLGKIRCITYINHTRKVRILKQHIHEGRNGAIYYQVTLYKDGKRYPLSVHRLVLSSFRPKGHRDGYFSGAIVDHIVPRSSTVCDNSLSNLHWVDYSQNRTTEHCKELMSKALTNRKDLSKSVKVTDLNTNEITIYPSVSEAERAFRLSHIISDYIKKRKGYYKKLNLHFAYV